MWINYPDNSRCYYFYALTGLLSPQLFLLGLLHYAHRAQTKLLYPFFTRWESRQQQLAKIILGAILSLGNFSFTALQLHFLVSLQRYFLNKPNLFSFVCSSPKGLGLTKSRTTPTTDCRSQAWLSPFDGFDYRINRWSNHLDLRLDYHPLLGSAVASLHALANHKQQWQISMQGNTRTIEEEDQDSSRPNLFFIF